VSITTLLWLMVGRDDCDAEEGRRHAAPAPPGGSQQQLEWLPQGPGPHLKEPLKNQTNWCCQHWQLAARSDVRLPPIPPPVPPPPPPAAAPGCCNDACPVLFALPTHSLAFTLQVMLHPFAAPGPSETCCCPCSCGSAAAAVAATTVVADAAHSLLLHCPATPPTALDLLPAAAGLVDCFTPCTPSSTHLCASGGIKFYYQPALSTALLLLLLLLPMSSPLLPEPCAPPTNTPEALLQQECEKA
jgi:hypothetical protein